MHSGSNLNSTGEHYPLVAARSTNKPACLESKQQEKGLHAVEASVHKVTHEQVVRLWTVPANLEKLHEVKELPMDVTTCSA